MNDKCGLWAVVPVKRLADTKRRLMPLLNSQERAAFAHAMLEDVLSALTLSRSLAGIIVITSDQSAVALAQAASVRIMDDSENAGLIAALTKAARQLAEEGRDGMLVIPADVPLITAADIETLALTHRGAPSVTLVPACNDGGTNALCCSPPGVMRFCFGEDSFRQHRDEAQARGIDPQVLRLERIGQDIDRPADVAAFLRRPSATRSYAYLTDIGIAQRLHNMQFDAGKDSPAEWTA
ncbi:MAG: 2-phospho-L-lactate guanylyltransferase [Pseudomonadota bacterium]